MSRQKTTLSRQSSGKVITQVSCDKVFHIRRAQGNISIMIKKDLSRHKILGSQ